MGANEFAVSVKHEIEPPAKKLKLQDEPDEEDNELGNNPCQDYDKNEGVAVAVPSGSGLQLQVPLDACTDYVTPEELQRLHQFQVLDEVRSGDEDERSEHSDSSDGRSEGVPEEEIEKMLDEDLPEDFKGAPKPKEKPYVTRQKIVLEEKGVNQFEVLPLDWMMVRHYSGMPVYMHRATRVCTLGKPYFLGKGNTRRHDIPISAIPCLAYRRALEEEEKQKKIDDQIEEQIKNGTWRQEADKNKENADKNVSNTSTNEVNGNSEVKSNEDINSTNTYHKSDLEISITDNVNTIESGNNDLSEFISETSKKALKCPFSHKKVNESSEIEPNIANNLDNNCSNTAEQTHEHKNFDEAPTCVDDAEINPQINIDDSIDNQRQKAVVEQSEDDVGITHEVNIENGIDKPNVDKENGDKENQDEENDGAKTTDDIPLNRKPVVLPGGIVMPPPRVESAASSWKCQLLSPEQVTAYCRNLFRFNTLNIMHFRRWADRRKYTRARKALQLGGLALPPGATLITIPARAQGAGGDAPGDSAGRSRRDWVMNMNGRSYLSVFHEYVRRALQKQPVYEFKQLENASAPYQATVYIGGMQYGAGTGSSKRAAKANAAAASIEILIPEMRGQMQQTEREPDFSFFDMVGIEDPRIAEFCLATCEPSPHAILRTCLLRNFGAGDRHIHTEMKKLEYQKIELTMRVGRHSASVVCKNKKSAKQRASQAILQMLHPHVRSWGSLLRLYGSRSVKSCKERKLEEQQITLLQDSARQNEPNYAVLEKLREEMRKLRERDEAVVPIGTLLLRDDLPSHGGSNLNNVDL